MTRSRTLALLALLMSATLSSPAWAYVPTPEGNVVAPQPPPVSPVVDDHRVLWVLAGVALLAAVLALAGAVAVLWHRHQASSRLLPVA
jgi:hypothetical protein